MQPVTSNMITIEPLLPEHWNEVRQIYIEGIQTGNATFDQNPPEWQEWNTSHLEHCRLVAKENGKVLGWAALTPVSGRCVYAGVAEVSIYLSNPSRGRGIGKNLLKALIDESEARQIWTLQAGIFPENVPSIKIHETLGFRIVGRREKIGKMNGVWRDTLLLERRSDKVGQ